MSQYAIPLLHSIEIILLVVWVSYIYTTLTGEKVVTINSVSPQPWGIVMVVLGFGMLISCKKWGIDTTIAGGVIGAGVNMLTGKDPAHPIGSKTQETTTVTQVVPPLIDPSPAPATTPLGPNASTTPKTP